MARRRQGRSRRGVSPLSRLPRVPGAEVVRALSFHSPMPVPGATARRVCSRGRERQPPPPGEARRGLPCHGSGLRRADHTPQGHVQHSAAGRPHGRSPPCAPVAAACGTFSVFLVCRRLEALARQRIAASIPGVRRRGGALVRRLVFGRVSCARHHCPPSHGAQRTLGRGTRADDAPFWCVFGVPPCQLGAVLGRLRATTDGGLKKAPALSL